MIEDPFDQPAILNIGPRTPFRGDACYFRRLDDAVRYAVKHLAFEEKRGSYIQLDNGDEFAWRDIVRLYALLAWSGAGLMAAAPESDDAPISSRCGFL